MNVPCNNANMFKIFRELQVNVPWTIGILRDHYAHYMQTQYVASYHGYHIYPRPIFLFGDVIAYACLEMFLCFFQQFDRLAYVSSARFISLFLDLLSVLAPHDLNLAVYTQIY